MARDAPCPSIPGIAPNQTRVLLPCFVKRFNQQEMPHALITHLLLASPLACRLVPLPGRRAEPGAREEVSLPESPDGTGAKWAGRAGAAASEDLTGTLSRQRGKTGPGSPCFSLRLLRSLPLAPEPADPGLQSSALLPVMGEPGTAQMEGCARLKRAPCLSEMQV